MVQCYPTTWGETGDWLSAGSHLVIGAVPELFAHEVLHVSLKAVNALVDGFEASAHLRAQSIDIAAELASKAVDRVTHFTT